MEDSFLLSITESGTVCYRKWTGESDSGKPIFGFTSGRKGAWLHTRAEVMALLDAYLYDLDSPVTVELAS